MEIKTYKRSTAFSVAFKYLMLVIAGTTIILVCSLFQTQSPVEGEYHYSNFLRVNFTWVAMVLFALTAFAAGYFYRLNPWGVGLCLVLVFPLTAIIELSTYPQSHNLIPFEMGIYFIYASPSIIMAAIAKFLRNRVEKRRIEKSKPLI